MYQRICRKLFGVLKLKATQQFHMQVFFCVEEAASDFHLFLYVGCSMNLLLRKMSTGAALVKKI